MKKYIYIGCILLLAILLATLAIQQKKIKKFKNLYIKELSNVEAYKASNSGLESEILQYTMTIDEVRASKDSLDRKISSMIDEMKVKDKKIEYLQYQTKTIVKNDTICFLDTLFVHDLKIDTLLKDDWYSLNLSLSYPSTVIVSPEFISEQYIVVHNKKEYNKPKSKVFFVRWFQKKHNVTEVEIKEKSPYVKNKTSKFIKIENNK